MLLSTNSQKQDSKMWSIVSVLIFMIFFLFPYYFSSPKQIAMYKRGSYYTATSCPFLHVIFHFTSILCKDTLVETVHVATFIWWKDPQRRKISHQAPGITLYYGINEDFSKFILYILRCFPLGLYQCTVFDFYYKALFILMPLIEAKIIFIFNAWILIPEKILN
jgi:hypothetical protein